MLTHHRHLLVLFYTSTHAEPLCLTIEPAKREGRARSRKLWAWRSGRGFLFLALLPTAFCPGQVTSTLAVLPEHRGVRGPLSFMGHSEVLLINICEASETSLHWSRFCEQLLVFLLRKVKVGKFLVLLLILELVKSHFTLANLGPLDW